MSVKQLIARRTASAIATVADLYFIQRLGIDAPKRYFDPKRLRDFFHDNDFIRPFIEFAKHLDEDSLHSWIQDLHDNTGVTETFDRVHENVKVDPLSTFGQIILLQIAESLIPLIDYNNPYYRSAIDDMANCLKLDGYDYVHNRLVRLEESVIDEQEEAGLLVTLYSQLPIQRQAEFKHALESIEKHYIAGSWTDVITNSRNIYELALEEAAKWIKTKSADADKIDRPVRVREYLEKKNLYTAKERESIDALYGLLSETGSHPYIASSAQARLYMHLALTLTHSVLLRLQGYIAI